MDKPSKVLFCVYFFYCFGNVNNSLIGNFYHPGSRFKITSSPLPKPEVPYVEFTELSQRLALLITPFSFQFVQNQP